MKLTRRFWGVVTLAILSGAGAVAFERPALLVAAVGPLAWLVSRQYAFVRAAGVAVSGLDVEFTPERRTTPAGKPLSVTVSAKLPRPVSAVVSIEPDVPVGAAADAESTMLLESPATDGSLSFDVTWRVAGRYELPPARVVVEDAAGLFSVETTMGDSVVVDVDPARATDVLVRGGRSDRFVPLGVSKPWLAGQGTEVADIREYKPGDPTNHIEWKATARRGSLHIREFEAETNPSVMVVFDARARLSAGETGGTKLAYLREVALSFLQRSRNVSEPLGLTVVSDDGRPTMLEPGSAASHYKQVREKLFEAGSESGSQTSQSPRSPGSARAAALALETEQSPFARQLEPFFQARAPYASAVANDPLYRAIVRHGSVAGGDSLTVICTDDADRTALVEAVTAARRFGSRVLVFLTPTARFDGRLTQDRLDEFERVRAQLAGMPNVWAYEVAPGHSIETSEGEGDAGPQSAVGEHSTAGRGDADTETNVAEVQ